MLPLLLFRNVAGDGQAGPVCACLGNAKWAALAWPTVHSVAESGAHVYTMNTSVSAKAEWVHVENVDNFECIPYKEVQYAGRGIVLEQSGALYSTCYAQTLRYT